ncbi:MAG TPA: ATP-binding protein [Rariglobus sp.]|nr:ATP-binding protein [Rariglobus sp.]
MSVASSRELAKLRTRLAVADETLHAIRNGEVDAVVGTGKKGTHVFTLEGAEHAYRVLIESMNEGALTLSANKMVLYANQSFARMVQCPLEQVTGSSFRRFLSFKDRASLRPLMKKAAKTGAKMQLQLIVADGSRLPVQISVRELAKVGFERVTISMVVTDMTEPRRNETQLRSLTHRVVQVQEAERASVALELHDNITQLLAAVLFRSQTLVNKLSSHDGPAKIEAIKLRELLGQAGEEVERISRNLRPSVLGHMGLDAVLRSTGMEFTERTDVPVELVCVQLAERLPADTELALYRILQEALKNVEHYAHARHVTITLSRSGADHVQLTIKDDGIGFSVDRRKTGRKGKISLGLLGMRERAIYVGGELTVISVLLAGTEIKVRVPLRSGVIAD